MTYAPPNPSCIPDHPGVTAEFKVDGRAPKMFYVGSQSDLIAAGVATAEMFPPRGLAQRYARGVNSRSPDYFAVARQGRRFLVKRWAYWNDPQGQARAIQAEPHRHLHLKAATPPARVTQPLAAVKAAANTAQLSEDAIAIAEGWSILPPRMKAHVQCLINDHIATECPALAKLYEAGRMDGQIRWKWKELDLYAKAQGRSAAATDDDEDEAA